MFTTPKLQRHKSQPVLYEQCHEERVLQIITHTHRQKTPTKLASKNLKLRLEPLKLMMPSQEYSDSDNKVTARLFAIKKSKKIDKVIKPIQGIEEYKQANANLLKVVLKPVSPLVFIKAKVKKQSRQSVKNLAQVQTYFTRDDPEHFSINDWRSNRPL